MPDRTVKRNGCKLFLVASLSMMLIMAPFSSALSVEPQYKTVTAPNTTKQIFKSNNALIHANILTYIPKENLVIATGDVEITQQGRILLADKLTYNQKTTIVEAIGNVSLLEPDGTVYFASHAELKDDMKQGIIDSFSARFADDSLIAANSAVRHSEDVTVLRKAVYSPCQVCEGFSQENPLWQLSASKVKVDNEEQKVSYKHAFFEVYGLPILYTPYMSHATPGADRKSGFMIPSYSSVNTLGSVARVPYYWNIAPNKDMIIVPTYTSQEGLVMDAEYRHKVVNGDFTLRGTITNPDKRDGFGNKSKSGQEIRGHLEGFGRFNISDTWHWGFSGKRASDDTYLKRYKYGDDDLLTSTAYIQQIDGDDYFSMETISFQGLNAEDDPDTTPLILPIVNSHIQTDSGWMNSWFSLDSNILSLHRTEGVDSRRVSTTGTWSLPYATEGGHLFKLRTSVRGDAYDVNDVIDPSNSNDTQDGFVGRFVPEIELNWSWPLARHGESTNIFFEPIAQFIISPHGNNPSKIPNEDSQEIEISDMNLFSSNHFTGLDLVEGGPRTNYGFRSLVDLHDLASLNFLFGQNYRTKRESKFTPESGLDKNFSDFVGRAGLSILDDNVDINYRFRLDREGLDSRRSEIDGAFHKGPVSLNIGYLLLNEGTTQNPVFDREEVTASGNIKLTEYWSLNSSTRRDLSEGGGFISADTGLTYTDECTVFSILFNRDFTSDRDVKPSESITIQLFLKNLN